MEHEERYVETPKMGTTYRGSLDETKADKRTTGDQRHDRSDSDRMAHDNDRELTQEDTSLTARAHGTVTH